MVKVDNSLSIRKQSLPFSGKKTIAPAFISAVFTWLFISSLHFCISVFLHREFGSKLFIDMLCSIGVCAPYKEAVRFQDFVILCSGDPANIIARPGWSGFTEAVCNIEVYERSAVIPLPFVNLHTSNPTTIFICLLQAAKEGDRLM
ncbi:hypothetical protein PR048_011530 [Dryococelus australis]|uniref:Uncharacterized protein n=1 Tax=Dryococelus australis TaxID=614101 RepID=A0ABQ9HLU3_9NEOP|nr:hypothetical protein PR048_011530 [Dryococelus australis]